MVLGGILGNGEWSGEAARRSELKAIPGKLEFLHLIATLGSAKAAVRRQLSEQESGRHRRKGRRELSIGGLRQAGLAEWAAKAAVGISWPK